MVLLEEINRSPYIDVYIYIIFYIIQTQSQKSLLISLIKREIDRVVKVFFRRSIIHKSFY